MYQTTFSCENEKEAKEVASFIQKRMPRAEINIKGEHIDIDHEGKLDRNIYLMWQNGVSPMDRATLGVLNNPGYRPVSERK